MSLKTCNRCGESKPETNYDKGRGVCRQCRYSGSRREWILENQRRFRAANPDVIKERNGAYYAANAEAIKENYRQNPHLRWTAEYRRRIKRMGIPGGPIEEFTKADVVAKYGDACHYCGGPFEEIDHAIPVSKSGPHTLANVRPSCSRCNRTKGTKVAS